jgi:hypothetical protein
MMCKCADKNAGVKTFSGIMLTKVLYRYFLQCQAPHK